MEWLDTTNVISWEGRPKRQRRAPPKTYWEEYVETDEWYHKELLGDVPPDEIEAACFDSDIDDGPGSESSIDSESEDVPYSEIEGDDASDTESISSAASEGGPTEPVIAIDTDDDESVSSCEGESGGEGSDDESEGGSVPQTRADSVD